MDSISTIVLAITALVTTNVVAMSFDRDRRRTYRRRQPSR